MVLADLEAHLPERYRAATVSIRSLALLSLRAAAVVVQAPWESYAMGVREAQAAVRVRRQVRALEVQQLLPVKETAVATVFRAGTPRCVLAVAAVVLTLPG